MKRVLAFDFGASNGRAFIGEKTDGKIVYTEVHRFSNDPVSLNGKLYWDFLRLFHEIKTGIVKAKQAGGFDSIGIDTWGVDYGFIDKKGDLINTPYHYRDLRTEGAMEKVFPLFGGKENLYKRTGTQFMRFNTLFQLYVSVNEDKEAYERSDCMLFMPDLMAYMLTGAKVAEYTIASTSQMINPVTGDWDYETIEKIGFDVKKLPEIVPSGHVYGNVKKEICEELGIDTVPVIAVCTHDTGSAVAAVPADMENTCYISCGTWSLMGVELDKPVLTDESFAQNFTNEGGYNKSIRFLKNIMGLWIIQESRRRWEKEGNLYSFAELADMASKSKSVCYIDPDYPAFDNPGNMPERIREFCRKTGQNEPNTIGEFARCIYESLALKYRYTLESIQKLTGKKFGAINVIGGGCKAEILCKMTADICGVKVVAGPSEATALGNIAVQMIALDEVKDLKEAKKLIGAGGDVKEYAPTGEYVSDYEKFKSIIEKV